MLIDRNELEDQLLKNLASLGLENMAHANRIREFVKLFKHDYKHASFMPNPQNGDTSVVRTSSLSEKEIWLIGEREVASKREKLLIGR
jgi:hypothetical protein